MQIILIHIGLKRSCICNKDIASSRNDAQIIIDIINAKMDKTEEKYPVNKAKGVATRYNKL